MKVALEAIIDETENGPNDAENNLRAIVKKVLENE